MMYLIDTNIWLEILLDQQQAGVVGEFLAKIPAAHLSMSDFTFHSIALALTRRQKFLVLQDFIQDIFLEADVGLLSLSPLNTLDVISTMNTQKFDYDDAYQYIVADQYNLVLVSFDSDFDRTTKGRKSPQEILETLI